MSAKGWMLAAATLAIGLAATDAQADPPAIGQTHDPAWAGHTMVVAGHGFVPGRTEFRLWSPSFDTFDQEEARRRAVSPEDRERLHRMDPHDVARQRAEQEQAFVDRHLGYLGKPSPGLPAQPPANSVVCPVLKCSDQLAAIEFPRYTRYFAGPAELYCAVLWAGDKTSGWSRPWVFNATEAHFLTADRVAPGEAVRVIGRKLGTFHGPEPLVALLDRSGGRKVRCPIQPIYYGHYGHNRYYDWQFVVPADTPEGAYEVWVHNRTGEYLGWSGPLALEVRRPADKPRPVFNVKDFGAKGDAEADDTAALQKALEAAGRSAPAVVLLPTGTYRIVETVSIPPGVTVRGQGMGQSIIKSSEHPPFRGEREPIPYLGEMGWQPTWKIFYVMLWGRTDFGLEDLCLYGAGETAGVLLAVANGDQWSHNVRLERCRFVNEAVADTPVGGIVGPRPADGRLATKFWKGLYGGKQRRLRIARCQAENVGSWFVKLDHCYIGYNTCTTPHWITGGRTLERGCMSLNTILEHNQIVGPRGLAGGGQQHRLYVACNSVSRTLTCDGEAYMLEGSGTRWYGKCQFLDDRRLRTAGTAWRWADHRYAGLDPRDRPTWMEALAADLTDCYVVITKGKGLGQYRPIAKAEGELITLGRPWGVVPDDSSEATILYGSVENVFVNNMGFDTNGTTGGFFAGGKLNCIVDGTVGTNTAGPYVWSSVDRAAPGEAFKYRVVPDYFNQIIHGRWMHKGNVFLTDGVNERFDTADLEAVPQLGTLVLRNQVLYPRDFGWSMSSFSVPGQRDAMDEDPQRGRFPAMLVAGKVVYPVFEENEVRAAHVGVWLGRQTIGAIVRRNTFAEIRYEMVRDLGVDSLVGKTTTKTRHHGYWPQGLNINLIPEYGASPQTAPRPEEKDR